MKVAVSSPISNSASRIFSAIIMLSGLLVVPSASASGNAISLAVTPKVARVKQKITLTASVTAKTGMPATGGTVTFFDGKLALASAQVVGNKPAAGYTTGNAALTTILAPGAHLLTAVYAGTAQSAGKVTSSAVALEVTGEAGSVTALTAKPNAQNPANYDFTATVLGYGFSAPTGTADFVDSTAKLDFGTAPLAKRSTQAFGNPAVINAQGMPTQIVVADFNGDGYPDIATPDAVFGPSTLEVFLGKANGEFQPPVSYPAEQFASSLLAADFNNDGILDLAVMSQADENGNGVVALYLGNGDGTFQAPINDVIGGTPIEITLGDFNRDGILDFASADYFGNSASISLGNGDGTFQPPVAYKVGSGPYSISSGDFNNDGFEDLAIVNDNDDTVSVLLGKGNGKFQLQTVYNTGFQVEYVVAADLNGDGNQDLMVANFGEQTVGVLLGNGDGTFQDQVAYAVGGYDSGIAVGDLNGDGIPDLAVAYYQPASVGVLIGNGDGTFAPVKDYATGQTQGYEVTIADLNGDGTPDVIVSDIHSSISVLLNGTESRAKLTNVAVPGTAGDSEKITATYTGDSHYKTSKSAALKVKGSGTK